jgi:hypothetical protein
MTNDLEKRLERLGQKLREEFASIPNGFLPLLVFGGLTPLPVIASDDIGNEWFRDVAGGETVEDFGDRAARESRAAGARLCTVGGMGRETPLQVAALRAAWDEYMATDYPDVPPIEESWPSRRAPVVTSRAPLV